MADRYQDRTLNADGFTRGGDQHQRAESDPLAELARLIGQNDGPAGRGGNPLSPSARTNPPNPFPAPADEEGSGAAGPPPWMQRANRKEIPLEQQKDFQSDGLGQPDFQASVHPLHRLGAEPPPLEPGYQHRGPAFAQAEEEPDPSRYDEALFGQIDTGQQHELERQEAYPDDPYAYPEDGYEDEEADEPEQKGRGGLLTIVAVLALAVIGTGAAFAYRTYMGSSRSGEPPIIKADNAPTKVVPMPQDGGNAKLPDRLSIGDSTEKLVPREETPVDVNTRSIAGGPRVVFPSLNPNSNPPSPSSVSPSSMPQVGAGGGAPSNGTVPNGEPRKIRTLSVRGDQPPDGAAAPAAAAPPPAAAKPAAGAKTARTQPSPANANASANAPVSLSPQAGQDSVPPASEPRARVAATNPAQNAPTASADSSGYLVQISSQRNEADAQASFKALQSKFPSVLGSQTPVIKRADLGDKGIYYRAMVGPFGSSDEAAQFCNSLRSAGGQCFIPKN
jgi:cell division protein FtsN